MFWRGLFGESLLDKAALFRCVHEAWLDRALESGRRYPRIPLRRADSGGFDSLRRRLGGRERAEKWWSLALTKIDSDPA